MMPTEAWLMSSPSRAAARGVGSASAAAPGGGVTGFPPPASGFVPTPRRRSYDPPDAPPCPTEQYPGTRWCCRGQVLDGPGRGNPGPICYYPHRRNSPDRDRWRRLAHDRDRQRLHPRPLPLQAGLERRGELRLQAQEGPVGRHRPRDVVDEGRAPVDARQPPQVAAALREAPHAELGRRYVADLL